VTQGNTESIPEPTADDKKFLDEAIKEARKGMFEGGIPVGAVLVVDGKIVGRGNNRRVQHGSPILHGACPRCPWRQGLYRWPPLRLLVWPAPLRLPAVLTAEMMCLESAGRLPMSDYRRATLYTTLSPCAMCSGAVLHYQIPRVCIADSEHFQGEEMLLMTRGVEVLSLDFPDAKVLVVRLVPSLHGGQCPGRGVSLATDAPHPQLHLAERVH
jgi:cytosine deaminase